MSNIEKYKEAVANAKKAQEEARKIMKDAFHDGTKVLFDENPTLTSFAWNQYTPYFNDGDECTFSVNYDCGMKINDIDLDEEQDDEEVTKEQIKNCEDLSEKVQEFLSLFETNDFKEMFGDHTEVRVSKDKIDTEEYSHD